MGILRFVLTVFLHRNYSVPAVALSLFLLVACDSYQYYVAELTEAPVQKERTHLVQKGDTLYSIAWIYDMDYRHLATLNGIAPPYRIYPGQRLGLGIFFEQEHAFPDQLATAPTAVSFPEKAIEKNKQLAPRPSPAPSTSVPKPPSKNQKSKPLSLTERASKKNTETRPENGDGGKKTTPGQDGAKKTPAKSRRADNSRLKGSVAWRDGVAWSWPATGKLISGFKHSDYENGITISGYPDDKVHAAANGRVVYSGRGLRHYGALLIVKHNADYFSAYALNKQLFVKEGTFVKAGESIAIMGTDARNRPSFYFEIRFKGKPLDPLKILSKRNLVSSG